MTPQSYQELFLEDHFADDAMDGLEWKLKHLREGDEAQSVVRLTIGEDVCPQGLLLDLPVTTRYTEGITYHIHVHVHGNFQQKILANFATCSHW